MQIPPHPGSEGTPRARSGVPGALLVGLGLLAVVAIGGGVYLAVGGTGSSSSATAGSATATVDEPKAKKAAPKAKKA